MDPIVLTFIITTSAFLSPFIFKSIKKNSTINDFIDTSQNHSQLVVFQKFVNDYRLLIESRYIEKKKEFVINSLDNNIAEECIDGIKETDDFIPIFDKFSAFFIDMMNSITSESSFDFIIRKNQNFIRKALIKRYLTYAWRRYSLFFCWISFYGFVSLAAISAISFVYQYIVNPLEDYFTIIYLSLLSILFIIFCISYLPGHIHAFFIKQKNRGDECVPK